MTLAEVINLSAIDGYRWNLEVFLACEKLQLRDQASQDLIKKASIT